MFGFRRKTYSDAQVVVGYQTGEEKVQRFWYDKCRRQFGIGSSNYGSLTDYDREDLFQDSFILVWEKMVSKQIFVEEDMVYITSRSGIAPHDNLMAYFMNIVRNKYMEMLRSGKYVVAINPEITASDKDIVDVLYWDEDPEVEKDRIVSQCLLSLPKSCLEILTKFYYEKKSLEQILAERPENSSYDGLKSRKSKCMANLKRRINESFAKAGLQGCRK